ncbi:adenine/guanine phosphoribosyltransferase-like PRPP-binding protein [Kitasatospora sp. MAA19]|uniref:phosphoribosyltransferase n=1 Tax=Kitasatospora sp. MAA19 TaxID=3035090 RepID=UPI0024732D76|nr:phosphoribosyltransferase [Kitasatospora sp. MAA19]MDH6705341.1 adenine/guanine phosphoribosyltransferase-like PRPP-binding protein [Kitasatospora sp. MAA19]
MTAQQTWTGRWVSDRAGIALTGSDRLPELVGLALRENRKRAHLLVSTVLGKHVPQRPAVVHGAGLELGRRVHALLGDEAAARAVVLGYAETATGLGHSVADGLDAPYLHSTRRPVPGVPPVGGFEEEHSHATSHLLLPADPELLAGDGPLVLVDDEFSTGRTVLNTIRELHARHPRGHYVVVALVDLRSAADRRRLVAAAAELGVRLDLVATATGAVELPADVLDRAERLIAEATPAHAPAVPAGAPAPLVRVELDWPAGLPDGGRHGFTARNRARLDAALPGLAGQLAEAIPATARRVLVLGFEELMYAPLRLADALAERLGGDRVRYSTTTRSPVLAVDDPGYAIRTRLAFPAHDDPQDDASRERYAYNVAPGTDPARRFDAVVLVVDDVADTAALHEGERALLGQLRQVTDQVVLAVLPSHRPVRLPSPLYGPEFSSYRPDEVTWLLKDLSGVPLEAPTEEREEAVQNGGAHYAESLPVEYQPSPEYQELFHQALRASARRIALAVGTVAETLLSERGPGLVLASLARAGTPVGILIRRWLGFAHGLDTPHYAVSIVRGRGIDPVALRYLAAHHHAGDVVFVDGWTGKGAITRELADALAGTGFDPDLAVLADPGRCVRTYGTRDDFLIPSACLNSTVSGLISRTVLRPGLIGPDDFHGAKHYAELAGGDASAAFLDTVADHFAAVRAEAVAAAGRLSADPDRTPDWAGWATVERISTEYGIDSVNLVKPGVGETTRVLLRRVPWRILARRGAGADLDHVRLLAAQRGVRVEEVDGLPYSCVGLIHPRYSRGATGASGTAVLVKES